MSFLTSLSSYLINPSYRYKAYKAQMWVKEKVERIPQKLNDWEKDLFDILETQKNTTVRYRLNLKNRSFFIIPTLEKAIFISDPEIIKQFLYQSRNGEFLTFGFNHLIEPLTGKNNMLLCSGKEEHRKLRCPLEQFFTPRNLKKQAHEISQFIFDYIQFSKNELMDPSDLAFHIISRFILGLNANSEDFDTNLLEVISRAKNYQREADLEDFQEAVETVFRSCFYEEGKGLALEQLQIAEDNGMLSKEEKISSVKAIYVAGMHTTQQFLILFFQTLQANYNYCDKIREEWNGFIAENETSLKTKEDFIQASAVFAVGGDINGKKYPGSKWLKNCYFEVSRLFPILPDLKRIANKTAVIGGITLSKGTEIHLNIYAYQRNSEIWGEKPEEFRPERFEKEGLSSMLYTFGLGYQSCIGRHLVEVQSKILMTQLLISCEWNREIFSKYYYNGFNLNSFRSFIGLKNDGKRDLKVKEEFANF